MHARWCAERRIAIHGLAVAAEEEEEGALAARGSPESCCGDCSKERRKRTLESPIASEGMRRLGLIFLAVINGRFLSQDIEEVRQSKQ
jgi:hypothetical protein